MITKKPYNKKLEIDLSGPEGNAYYLISVASKLSKQLKLSSDDIVAEMVSSDYENLIQTFDKHFGDYVILYKEF